MELDEEMQRESVGSSTDKSELLVCKDVLLLVRNIPSTYHSSDLRAFFSLFVERGAFQCFHFRHRPEKLDLDAKESDAKSPRRQKSLCCFVKVRQKSVADFFKTYNGKNWENGQSQLQSTRCHILRVRMPGSAGNPEEAPPLPADGSSQYLTRDERRAEQRYHLIHQELKESEINGLIEMTPPPVMPNGNVGSPTKHFLDLINSCRMPAGLIKKLGLRFPKGRKNRKFGQVGMDYGDLVLPGLDYDEELEDEKPERPSATAKFVWFDKSSGQEEGGDDGDDLDNDDCQEWERHEALNDDVTTHERNKERLFEDEAEVVWEKGGPGIVWNMDANLWKEKAGGDDIDEATDDWDVDMSCYYEDEKDRPGDRDARDFMQMRREKEMRAGTAPSVFRQSKKTPHPSARKTSLETLKSGAFEKHTKGIGKKLLEKSGWKEGTGIGKWKMGIVDPLSGNGQLPHSKRGFGFSSKEISNKNSFARPAKIHQQAVLEPGNSAIQITTCYDPRDPGDTLKRRAAPSRLTFRSPDGQL